MAILNMKFETSLIQGKVGLDLNESSRGEGTRSGSNDIDISQPPLAELQFFKIPGEVHSGPRPFFEPKKREFVHRSRENQDFSVWSQDKLGSFHTQLLDHHVSGSGSRNLGC